MTSRSTSRQRPERSWDWILCPPLWPLALMYGVVRIYQRVKHKYQQSRLRKRLGQRGRFIDESTVAVKLGAGEGTMIIQVHSHPLLDVSRDCAFLWWTSDDVLTLAPVVLPPTRRQAYEGWTEGEEQRYRDYVKQFATRYIDERNGLASLTRFPQQIANKVPQERVVTLIEDTRDAVLIRGDYCRLLDDR